MPFCGGKADIRQQSETARTHRKHLSSGSIGIPRRSAQNQGGFPPGAALHKRHLLETIPRRRSDIPSGQKLNQFLRIPEEPKPIQPISSPIMMD
jgi:hypothetical protein